MAKILLLEDDEILSETLIELFESENFEIVHVKDGEEALDATFVQSFDLFLLDVNVPFLNGFDFLKSLRDSGNMTPSIFITALSDVRSLSKGFDVGADDYIKKPFDFDELLIRIKALLKKQYHTYANEIRVNNFRFVIEKNELYIGADFIPLPPYELHIVRLLFQNLNKTLLKDILLNYLNEGKETSEGALRVHIARLRKVGLPITTIKRVGYRLTSE